ncbi:epithelial-stromal interaction protein 1 isoform X5 [Manis pentadactyla]|uniref:epithelial-stromal interaction protein 1 isoform X5 n=1 Tax=Manis pentadactyla TaxID=143292 RepID=UPI00255C7E0B|nr:epithelial-stromal interaction protein 1 isoform X5 [Manis pentadactyla]
MSTRTAVVGAAPRAAPAARPAPGPPGRRPEPEPLRSPSRESAEHAGRRLTGTYTLIAPNENRRNRIQRIAEQELENLEKWKEQHRAKPVSLVPRQLGGSQSEAEVRQKQQLQLMQAKYRQKLKREESVRIRKEAEEAEIQKMKAIQREKSNKLEEKKRLQENLRREAFREHQQYKTAGFLNRLDTKMPCRSQIAPCDPQSSTWNELLEFKQQQQEEERTKTHQAEHRRVNNAFLDRLQGKSQPGGFEHGGSYWNMNGGNSWDI